jgi:hypothetical protein
MCTRHIHGKTVDTRLYTHAQVFESACGVLSDHGLSYVGVLQRACDAHYGQVQLEAAIATACQGHPSSGSSSSPVSWASRQPSSESHEPSSESHEPSSESSKSPVHAQEDSFVEEEEGAMEEHKGVAIDLTGRPSRGGRGMGRAMGHTLSAACDAGERVRVRVCVRACVCGRACGREGGW